jgi:tRNA A58 N-methylase Trm61
MPTRQPLLAAALLLLIPASVLAQQDAADTTRIVEHLQIQPGLRVAEIGAGTGSLTVAIAKAVGPSGHVFSNEIDPGRRQAIRTAVEQAGLSNVTIVESGATDANLSADCCVAIFMRNVYHHFDDPAAMNASLYRALLPGGRIAVIDFPPRGGEEATSAAARDQGNTHGVTPQSIERELRAAGFDLVMTEQPRGDRWFMVVARKGAQ